MTTVSDTWEALYFSGGLFVERYSEGCYKYVLVQDDGEGGVEYVKQFYDAETTRDDLKCELDDNELTYLDRYLAAITSEEAGVVVKAFDDAEREHRARLGVAMKGIGKALGWLTEEQAAEDEAAMRGFVESRYKYNTTDY